MTLIFTIRLQSSIPINLEKMKSSQNVDCLRS